MSAGNLMFGPRRREEVKAITSSTRNNLMKPVNFNPLLNVAANEATLEGVADA